ncbi:MAG: class I SAM-dependent methyltransferase [Bacteroidota bacterium]|nr:class I SAM-dependent methyltransferase [Bacteroidota bacterium]
MKCKICKEKSIEIFEAKILSKYIIKYYKCTNCHFIQTEEVFWIKESYNNAITDSDIGYVTRNLMYSEIVTCIINYIFKKEAKFIDYGGGYGLFVRLMRDQGFDFYWQDLYCKNIFANNFRLTDINKNIKFELLTAFEVFEHLNSPMEEIKKMFNYTDSILFVTELQPHNDIKNVSDWWYFSPEFGQHISFYSLKTLEIISDNLCCNLYTDKCNIHLLTKKKLNYNLIKYISIYYNIKNKLLSRYFQNKNSLLKKDFEMLKNQI